MWNHYKYNEQTKKWNRVASLYNIETVKTIVDGIVIPTRTIEEYIEETEKKILDAITTINKYKSCKLGKLNPKESYKEKIVTYMETHLKEIFNL